MTARNVTVVGRKAARSLYRPDVVTFEEDAVYDQRDAAGFIKLNALRMRIAAIQRENLKKGKVKAIKSEAKSPKPVAKKK